MTWRTPVMVLAAVLLVVIVLGASRKSSPPDPVKRDLRTACAIEIDVIDQLGRHVANVTDLGRRMDDADTSVGAAASLAGADELKKASLLGLDQEIPFVNRLLRGGVGRVLGTPGLDSVLANCTTIDHS